jgi:hypothetical protein
VSDSVFAMPSPAKGLDDHFGHHLVPKRSPGSNLCEVVAAAAGCNPAPTKMSAARVRARINEATFRIPGSTAGQIVDEPRTSRPYRKFFPTHLHPRTFPPRSDLGLPRLLHMFFNRGPAPDRTHVSTATSGHPLSMVRMFESMPTAKGVPKHAPSLQPHWPYTLSKP